MSTNNHKIIDIHNHSLPCIDDGAKDLKMSIEMLKIAANCGTTDIVLTPHHLNGAFNNFANDVIKHTIKLRSKVEELNIPIELHFGSEVHLVPETVNHLIENKTLTYCGLGKAALIELPKSNIPSGTESILSELIYNDITPIIAHPERNSTLRQDFTPLQEWIEFGCKSQVTGQSCTGSFGKSIQALSFELIANNLVHFIASDAHRPEGRSPNLTKAYNEIVTHFDKKTGERLFHDNPSKLINGLPVSDLGLQTNNYQHLFTKTNKKKKGFFGIFKN